MGTNTGGKRKGVVAQMEHLEEKLQADGEPEGKEPLTTLDVREEKFARFVAQGLTQTEAARQAGYSQGAAHVQASRLMKRDTVRERIAQLMAPIDVETAKKDHIDRLSQLRDRALSKGQLSAAIKAEELRGKVLGLYVEQSVVQNLGDRDLDNLTPEQLREQIADAVRRLGISRGKLPTDEGAGFDPESDDPRLANAPGSDTVQ